MLKCGWQEQDMKQSHYLQCRGEVWEKVRMRCLVRDNFQCQVSNCTETRLRYLQVHHKQWRIHGGTHDLDNLVTLCRVHHAELHPHMRQYLGKQQQALAYAYREL